MFIFTNYGFETKCCNLSELIQKLKNKKCSFSSENNAFVTNFLNMNVDNNSNYYTNLINRFYTSESINKMFKNILPPYFMTKNNYLILKFYVYSSVLIVSSFMAIFTEYFDQTETTKWPIKGGNYLIESQTKLSYSIILTVDFKGFITFWKSFITGVASIYVFNVIDDIQILEFIENSKINDQEIFEQNKRKGINMKNCKAYLYHKYLLLIVTINDTMCLIYSFDKSFLLNSIKSIVLNIDQETSEIKFDTLNIDEELFLKVKLQQKDFKSNIKLVAILKFQYLNTKHKFNHNKLNLHFIESNDM